MTKKLKDSKALQDFIKKNTCFQISTNKLFCNICDEEKTYDSNEGVRPLKRHLESKKHLKSERLGKQQKRLKLTESGQNGIAKFHLELIEALVSSNIPIHKLENTLFKSFLEKYCGKSINSHSFYRGTVINTLYENLVTDIKNLLSESEKYYIIFDETTDTTGRYVLNLLIGICSKCKRTRPFLISVIELEKTTSEKINLEVVKKLTEIFNGEINRFEDIILLLTDAAPYAIKTGKLLQQLMPNLRHVTCICHGLHNLCETIRGINFNVNDLISFLKNSLVKNKEKQILLKDTTGLTLPKWPVVTRWGTWLIFASWIFDNFEMIKKFIFVLTEKFDTDTNKRAYENINSKEFENEIRIVNSLKFTSDAIFELESEKLSTEQQINILVNVSKKLENYEIYQIRFQKILDRNPSLNCFMDFDVLKCREEEKYLVFVPLTTVEVERSFSKFNDLLSDKRKKMTMENLEKYLIVYFNQKK